MLSVQTNVSAISAQRHLGATSNALGTAMERLSSGFRINRAADDAAGLAVSEKLKAQIGGLNQASRNSRDGISMIQTAEGALSEVQSMMQRMRDLGVQGASDSNSQTERQNINLELVQLQQEIDSISGRTKFNGQGLLDGSLTSQQAGTAVTNGANGELMTGDVVGTTGAVTNIDVSGASASRSYTLTGNTTTGTITATEYSYVTNTSGTTLTATGLSQQLTAVAITTGGSEMLNFTTFGVKITIGAGMATNATGASGIAASVNLQGIDTATGSGTATLQTGANQGDSTAVAFVDTRLQGATAAQMQDLSAKLAAFTTAANGTDASTARTAAGNLIASVDSALAYVSSSRATLGAAQNRLQHTIANLSTTSENLSASNSRIRDVDVALESSNMAKNQVLEQAGVSVLAQANQLPQLALKLLG
jgi:flagellin